MSILLLLLVLFILFGGGGFAIYSGVNLATVLIVALVIVLLGGGGYYGWPRGPRVRHGRAADRGPAPVPDLRPPSRGGCLRRCPLPHREAWVAVHGRLPAEALGVGTRCGHWRRKALDT